MRIGVVLLLLFTSTVARSAPQAAAAPVDRTQLDRFWADPRHVGTRALGVYRLNGVVGTYYAPGYSATNRFIGWSATKSITCTAIGILVDAGKLQLDAPAPVPAWQAAGDPRRAITLRHLLHMSSGLQHDEGARDGLPIEKADTPQLLFGKAAGNAVAYAAAKPLKSPPGNTYEYSTATTTLLADIVSRTITSEIDPAKRKAIVARWYRDTIFAPMGMQSVAIEFDAAGNFLGGSLAHATLDDWAHFGLTYLRNGVGINGQAVVSPAWVTFVRTPSATDGGYGGHFWLNRPRTNAAGKTNPALFPEKGPADAYAAVGHDGQYVIIVPSKQIVVVRLGFTLDPQLQPVRDWLGDIVNSFPDVPPPK